MNVWTNTDKSDAPEVECPLVPYHAIFPGHPNTCFPAHQASPGLICAYICPSRRPQLLDSEGDVANMPHMGPCATALSQALASRAPG